MGDGNAYGHNYWYLEDSSQTPNVSLTISGGGGGGTADSAVAVGIGGASVVSLKLASDGTFYLDPNFTGGLIHQKMTFSGQTLADLGVDVYGTDEVVIVTQTAVKIRAVTIDPSI